jgi:hypothetical protein
MAQKTLHNYGNGLHYSQISVYGRRSVTLLRSTTCLFRISLERITDGNIQDQVLISPRRAPDVDLIYSIKIILCFSRT